MRIFVSLSGNKFYRGISSKFSKEYQNKSHIIWATSDIKYAKEYGDQLIEYDLELVHGFDFGFRTLDTQVKFSEVLSRVKRGVVDAYSKLNLISKSTAQMIHSDLSSLDHSGYKKVWEWYQTEVKLADLLLKSGYTHIDALEGKSNDIRTVGILNKDIIKGSRTL